MKTILDLQNAITNNIPLIWNDPLPIKDNDYTISDIEPLKNFLNVPLDCQDDLIVLIQYNNGGSEAEVFLSEIDYK